jgi:cysteine desulfurase/selenocysteine lyase
MEASKSNIQLDIQQIRDDFPILSQVVNGHPLVYLDNAATTQKPKQVIEALVDYYSRYNANIHRGVHALSQEATEAYEKARKTIQNHFNAQHAHEIIFTSGTTHGINLVAAGFESLLVAEDEIIISAVEHHSNIVPWQMLCEKTNARLKVIPILENGTLDMMTFERLLSDKTRLVSVNHISNSLGVINPIEEIIHKSHQVGAAVLIDGAQAAVHHRPNVQELDVDFYTCSGHKMYGPTGIGMLYGKESWLHKLPPYQGGGEMIQEVTFEKTTYAGLPHKFEAGTPNIAGAIGFGAAIDYLNTIGFEAIQTYESQLLEYATHQLSQIQGITLYGEVDQKSAVLSFNLKNIHPYDLGTILDKMGIAVRTGHHCAQPVMDYFNIPGTVRISLAIYNTFEEIDRLIEAILKAQKMLT